MVSLKSLILPFILSLSIGPRLHADECSDAWQVVSGTDLKFFPDTNAAYAVYRFVFDPSISLKITGEFAHSRFESFTLYEDIEGQLVDKLADTDVEADEGSLNPFRPGIERSTDARSYTLWIAPEETGFSGEANVLDVDEGRSYLTLIVRVYLPDEGLDELGGVDLPGIESLDTWTGEPRSCPQVHDYIREEEEPSSDDIELPVAETLSFYRIGGENAYPSYDTSYLFGIPSADYGDTLVMRFTPPAFTDTSSGQGSFTGNEQVRYWSMCLSRLGTTTTSQCLADYEIPIQSDGFVYLVLARPSPQVKAKAMRAGFGYLAWPISLQNPILLYRNMVINPAFEYGADQVPLYDPHNPQPAEHFIDTYAPQGLHCTHEEFLNDFCGILDE